MSRHAAWVEVCYRGVVRAYPRTFRERFGGELVAGFSSPAARAGGLRRWRWVLADAMVAVPREHLRSYRLRRGARAADLARRHVYRSALTASGGSPAGPGSPRRLERALGGGVFSDLRAALRSLLRSPAFTLVVVLSLALGIGTNTALFSVVNAIWLATVPGVVDTEELVELVLLRSGDEYDYWAHGDFDDIRTSDTPLAGMAGWAPRAGHMQVEDARHNVRMLYVSSNYFRILGVAPALGRGLLDTQDVIGSHEPVVVVSFRLWQEQLQARPDVIGTTIVVNGAHLTVVGVAPEVFLGHKPQAGEVDLWLPLPQHPYLARADGLAADRERTWIGVVGKLGEGATPGQVEAAVQTVMARLALEHPETNERRDGKVIAFGALPAANRYVDLSAVGALGVLVGLVLLIICGNVSGMVLARAATRERELAVRMALGSGRRRLVRYLMAEALVLAIAGGGLGVLAAFWATGAATARGLGVSITNISFVPNVTVVLYSLVLTFLATVLFGLMPALRVSRPELLTSLKDDSGGGGRRAARVHHLAASAQTGLAIFLLVVAGLFVRSVDTMQDRELGFEPRNLLVTASRVLPTMTTSMDLTLDGYESADRGLILIDRLSEAVGALPGVVSASVSDGFPLDMNRYYTRASRGDRPAEASAVVMVELTSITEGFFETIGTPILQGRGVESTDVAGSEPVVVVTNSLAARLWPGEEALGQSLRVPSHAHPDRSHRVIGVIGHISSSVAKEDLPQVFISLRQHYTPRLRILARGATDSGALGKLIQSAVVGVDPALAIPLVVDAPLLVAFGTSIQRTWAQFSAGFGLLALLLAAIGLYGVVAYGVANRTREIGIRMAVGATRHGVVRAVLHDAVRLAMPGLAIGAIAAVGVAAVLRSEFPGLNPVDPLSLVLAAAVLFLVVLLASFVPARRASGIDPMDALRSQ